MASQHSTHHISPTNSGPMGELVARVMQQKAPISLRRNYDVRCDACEMYSYEQDGYPCGRPTIACTECGAWTETCEKHGWFDESGAPICEECAYRAEMAQSGGAL